MLKEQLATNSTRSFLNVKSRDKATQSITNISSRRIKEETKRKTIYFTRKCKMLDNVPC